jgi:hypothetical protein
MHNFRPALSRCAAATCLALASILADAADGDIQRQLQQREQQQMELRLKMQQQLDRAVTPSTQQPMMGLQHRRLESVQQQRLQQLHDQQLRSTLPPSAAGTPEALREMERRRAIQLGTEQLNRFGVERQMQVDPRTMPSGTVGP